MITALIIEDEKNSREILNSLLEKYCPQIKVVDEAISSLDGLEKIKQYNPQVVFLDIEMPGGDAFQMLKLIENPQFEVIFITAFNHYAVQAIKFSALDYIVKPINPDELINSVDKLEQSLKIKNSNERILTLRNNLSGTLPKKLVLPTKEETIFVETSEIIYLRGEDNYTHFYFKNSKPLLVSKTLGEFEEILEDLGFLRSHKGYLINLYEVKKILNQDGGVLVMSDNQEIPIARRRRQIVQDSLKNISA